MSDAGMEGSGQPEAPNAAAGPGAQLASHRQALGWTVEQVANQLNLAPRQVQAMEDDNYAALPGMVIARGFVRAYAKLLKLDPAPLLALISEKAAPSPEALELRRTLSATFTEANLPTAKRSGNGGKWLALVLLLLILAAGGWLALREGWLAGLQLPGTSTAPAQQSHGTPEAGGGVPLGQSGEGAPASPAESGAQPPQSPGQALPQAPAPALAPNPAPSSVPPTAPAPVSNAAPAQPTVVAAAAATAAQAPTSGETSVRPGDKLVLKMREASWIELRREDGEAVLSRLVPAGSTESFDIAPGARLVVGNAAGVDAAFRGQSLDLNTGAKNNVARLTLK